MNDIPILKWTDNCNQGWDTLLLGNGASIALHDGFNYQSLYQQAYPATSEAVERLLFEQMKTCDFERVLSSCRNAQLVNISLNQDAAPIELAHRNIQKALIAAIHYVHPEYSSVEERLRRAAQFGSRFRTVISLNYDLTLYWASLLYNQKNGLHYKDGFIDKNNDNTLSFREDWSFLRRPQHGQNNATMIFYPHGNLCLTRDAQGTETKIISLKKNSTTEMQVPLLDAIMQRWSQDNCHPLFVSEGTSQQKKLAIQQSSYLWNVHEKVLKDACDKREFPQAEGALVIYGWSMNDMDNHILDALAHSKISKFAISVFSGSGRAEQQDYCNKITTKIKKRFTSAEIVFFDAQSTGCWIY